MSSTRQQNLNTSFSLRGAFTAGYPWCRARPEVHGHPTFLQLLFWGFLRAEKSTNSLQSFSDWWRPSPSWLQKDSLMLVLYSMLAFLSQPFRRCCPNKTRCFCLERTWPPSVLLLLPLLLFRISTTAPTAVWLRTVTAVVAVISPDRSIELWDSSLGPSTSASCLEQCRDLGTHAFRRVEYSRKGGGLHHADAMFID